MTNTIKTTMRNRMIANLTDLLEKTDEEVLRVKSNEIALPFVTDEGEEGFFVITVKIPAGSRDGDEYDGYAEAEDFAMKEKLKAEKAKENARKKAEKIAKDKAKREAKKKEKES